MPSLLEIKNLKKYFPIRSGLLLRQMGTVFAVDGVSLTLEAGKTLGLVGESGCGKSTLGRSVIRIYDPTEGEILFEGQNVSELKGKALKGYRRQVQMIFQDPFSSLNPRHTVSHILETPFQVHGVGSRGGRRQKVLELLEQVRLGSWAALRYPHEFSGGQRQRIAIARAIALRPKLVIADEPVSALDVSVQSQILNLLEDLQEELKLSYLFISHDLAVVKHVSDQIAVMYLGKVMEYADQNSIFQTPLHPYTQGLLMANPQAGSAKRKKRGMLKGEIPSPINPPSGCVFHTRCPYAEFRCKIEIPPLRNAFGVSHQVACHFFEEIQKGTKTKTEEA